ncbi:MAG: NAD(P)-binding protein, partial [Lentisphaeria bacterium]|nr:NAD(P)-binding protein [Lentisphaeria bacterium]
MKEIVIIGAGPAGLTAGIRLLQEGGKEYSVTVLEASSAVGGISRTVRHNGNRMDIGGHRFFSKDTEVNA